MENNMENDILNNVEYKEMLAQLEDLKDYYHQYKDDDSGTEDFNALDTAIKYLKHYYPIKINDYKTKIEYLENKDKQNYLNKEMLIDLLNDYRQFYQIIYKLIENKE